MKILVLRILRALGLFALCRRFYADKTLILAYHGFELMDETAFRDQLFIKAQTLKTRLDYLQQHCNVQPLQALDDNQQVKNKVIITIDDGWTSTLTVAAPIFKQYQMPYTVYLTTENVLDNQPIFHIALDYILGHNLGKQLKYQHEDGQVLQMTISRGSIGQIMAAVKPFKRELNDTRLLLDIAKALDFDFDPVLDCKALTLMSVEQVQAIKAAGADIQLHTHSHNTPLGEFDEFASEIEVNRKHIEDIIGETAVHHCYPSGVYNADSIAYLKRLNVTTATTCYPGLVTDSSDRLELPRFLDSENIPQIVFEAEVSGVLEVFRKLRTLVAGGNDSGACQLQ